MGRVTREQWYRQQHRHRYLRRLRFQAITFALSLSLLIGASIYFAVRPIS